MLSEGKDNRDITIKCLQAQLVEKVQILVDNRLMKPPRVDEGEPSREKSRGSRDRPRKTRREKQHEFRVDLESQGNNRYVASSKRRVPPRQA